MLAASLRTNGLSSSTVGRVNSCCATSEGGYALGEAEDRDSLPQKQRPGRFRESARLDVE